MSADGPACKAGVRQADRLVKVNNCSLVDADHHRAVEVLKATGLRIEVVVQRTGESERLAEAEHKQGVEQVASRHSQSTSRDSTVCDSGYTLSI